MQKSFIELHCNVLSPKNRSLARFKPTLAEMMTARARGQVKTPTYQLCRYSKKSGLCKNKRIYAAMPGANVMITIFADFCTIFGNKFGVLLDPNCYDHFCIN
jgi:hypothetical protein